MNDRIAAAEGKVSGAASEAAIWRSFIEHAGWIKFLAILEEQYRTRISMVALTPLESLSKVPAQEFMKGEANAYGAVRLIPQTLLEQAQSEVVMAETQLSQEKEDVRDQKAAAASSRVDDDNFSRDG